MTGLIINGLAQGASVALLAADLFIVYTIARTFHLALAGIYALSSFVAWEAHRAFGDYAHAALFACLAGAGISCLCELLNHGPLRKRGASSEAHLLSSLGIFVLITQSILIIWGPEARLLRIGV